MRTVRGKYETRDAVFDALRGRPDRIIVGELRDATALELLKAWNTGHRGGLATIHANDTRSMLTRVCQLIEEDPQATTRPSSVGCSSRYREPGFVGQAFAVTGTGRR